MSNGFQRVLDHIRSIAGSEAEKGRLFERLMKTYFTLGSNLSGSVHQRLVMA